MRAWAWGCLGMLGALVAPLAGEARAELVGINAHLPADDELDLLRDLGVSWIRIDNNWLNVEVSQGQYNWAELDRVVDGARARGMQVMMTVAYTPAWASEGDADGFSGNDVPRPGAFGAYVSAVVARYRDRVTHYGIWNEPNLEQFWAGDSAQYLDRVLRPGADAVHEGCAECRVLGPDLAGIGDWERFLRAVLDQDAGRIDLLTHHSYATAPGVRNQWLCDDLRHAMDIGEDLVCFYKPGLRQILDEKGWTGEVWLSEVGYRSRPWDSPDEQEKQRRMVEGTLALQAEFPWWTGTLFYEIGDCGAVDPACPIDGFGIARRTSGPDGSWEDNFLQKPAYLWLKGELANNPRWQDDGQAPEPDPEPPAPPRLEAPQRRDDAGLDGELGEWDDQGCALVSRFEVLERGLEGPGDLVARACAAWSPQALWLAVEVADDAFSNDHDPGLLWMGDSVQLAVDVDGDAQEGQGYDEDDSEWTLALSQGRPILVTEHGPDRGAQGEVRRAEQRTIYELRVPLAGLEAGRTLRASFLVNESDGQGRDGWLEWTPGIGREKRPALFGELALSARQSEPPPDPDAPDAGDDAGDDNNAQNNGGNNGNNADNNGNNADNNGNNADNNGDQDAGLPDDPDDNNSGNNSDDNAGNNAQNNADDGSGDGNNASGGGDNAGNGGGAPSEGGCAQGGSGAGGSGWWALGLLGLRWARRRGSRPAGVLGKIEGR